VKSETQQKVIDVLQAFELAPLTKRSFILDCVESLAMNAANRQAQVLAHEGSDNHQRRDTRRELVALQKAVEKLSPDARAQLSCFLVPSIMQACGAHKWSYSIGPDVDGLAGAVELALLNTKKQTRAQARDTGVLRMFICDAGRVFVMLGRNQISADEDGRFARFVKALDGALDTRLMPENIRRLIRDVCGATEADRQAFVSNCIAKLGRQKVLLN